MTARERLLVTAGVVLLIAVYGLIGATAAGAWEPGDERTIGRPSPALAERFAVDVRCDTTAGILERARRRSGQSAKRIRRCAVGLALHVNDGTP